MEGDGFLGNIRKAPDRVKTKWLIIFVVLAMLVLSFVWLVLFNWMVADKTAVGPSGGSQFSFWETMKTGTMVLGGKIYAWLAGLGKIIGTPKNYMIKP